MSGLIDSISRVRLIAGNTFLEAVRQKFFNSLLLISVALVASSTFFPAVRLRHGRAQVRH